MRVATGDGSKKKILRRNVKRFQGGLVFEAHGRVHHSTVGCRVIKKKRKGRRSHPQESKRMDRPDPHHDAVPQVRVQQG